MLTENHTYLRSHEPAPLKAYMGLKDTCWLGAYCADLSTWGVGSLALVQDVQLSEMSHAKTNYPCSFIMGSRDGLAATIME